MHTKRTGILLLCWTLAFPLAGKAAEDSLSNARKLLLGGKYAEAAELFEPLAEKSPAAAVGLARCLTAQGKLDEAAKRLSAAAASADVQAELARLAFERGDYKESKTRADEALRLDRRQLLAQWIAAELDRTAGRLDEADRAYRRLVTAYNADDIKQAESLRWIGLAAAQNARWHRLSDQFDFLVNELYPDALQLEPAYWPAHYEAGMLFLEKYNRADAGKEFRAALELNPNAAEVHAALAALALEQREIEKAEKSLARALEINPRLLAAWQLKADLLWANFQVAETLKLLEEKVLPLNPADEGTLGRVAACYVLLDKMPPDGRFAKLVERVTRQNPRAGEFYFTLASQLEDRNKQAEAETFLREAMRVMPRHIGPPSHLGLLYMRMGREDEARKVLKAAFESDPFNVRVNNMLEVLEVLDAMATYPSQRFILKYDAGRDKALAREAAEHIEKVYPELCKRFGYEPPHKPVIEMFNRARDQDGQQWFAARMTGLPYLGTVAASTGRVVAMVSPGDRRPRNAEWTRVLTHELVHVITLQQTHFNIPHWYTEGLAVWCEGGPRPKEWNELLRKRVPKGPLYNLDTLNFGFTRPDSSDDWQMAYCQALLYVEYMLSRGKKGDEDCLRKLLAAYTEGLATPAAIQRVFGVSQPEFEAGYVAFVKKQVAEMKTSEEKKKP
jgi:cellulose synthase operon protein C